MCESKGMCVCSCVYVYMHVSMCIRSCLCLLLIFQTNAQDIKTVNLEAITSKTNKSRYCFGVGIGQCPAQNGFARKLACLLVCGILKNSRMTTEYWPETFKNRRGSHSHLTVLISQVNV